MVAIFVVLTILLLVAIDAVLERRRRPQVAPATVLPMATEPVLPAGLFIHPGHTWTEILRSGLVRIGLDDLVRQALGKPDRLLLRNPGEQVLQGEPLMTIERDGHQLVLTAPLSGIIERTNEQLAAHPESLEQTAYGENWAYAIKPDRLGDEIGAMQIAEQGVNWLKAEASRWADWIGSMAKPQPGMAMQDGGAPVFGALAQLDTEAWKDFQQQFLAREIPEANREHTT
jgi:glycine cleavage system H protein